MAMLALAVVLSLVTMLVLGSMPSKPWITSDSKGTLSDSHLRGRKMLAQRLISSVHIASGPARGRAKSGAPHPEESARPRVLPRILAELDHMQQMHGMQQANAVLLGRMETASVLDPAAAQALARPLAPPAPVPAVQPAEVRKAGDAVGAAAGIVKPLLQDCMAVKGPVKPYTAKDFAEGKPTT